MIIDNGTAFHDDTPADVRRVISSLIHTGRRVRVFYGDTKTGKSWNELCDVTGTLGRSMGSVKIPLIIARRGCFGGPALLDHCIIRIDDTETHKTLYSHPAFHVGAVTVSGCVVTIDGAVFARCNTPAAAACMADFITGRRYTLGGRRKGGAGA